MKRSVLVVDDDGSVADAVEMLLEAAGYRVTTTESAIKALRIVEDNPPDAIMCDAAMPGMDGAELLSALRRNPATSSIPIIIMSGYDRCKVGEIGQDGFLWKPFLIHEMVAAIESAIQGNVAAFAC